MAELEVEIVAADHFVWSGAAKMVKARTSDGEIGILPGHSPLLAILADGGFFSVDNNRVVIVADNAHLGGSATAGIR